LDTDWFKYSINYQILIDRFSRGNSEADAGRECMGPVFCGGNLRGVIDRLEYLGELGVNTIWLSPFNSTAAYHGYHVTDFFNVDPRFGSVETVKELLERAHGRGMRVLMDFVANHVHRSHPIFKEALEDPLSPYRKWFFFKGRDSYLGFLNIPELPKLNLGDPRAAEYLINAALYWLQTGVDGLRLDHVIGPSIDFWRRFAASVKARHPQAVLIGEAFFSGITWRALQTIGLRQKRLIYFLNLIGVDATTAAMRQYVGVLDGVLDFRFRNLLKRFVARPKWYRPEWLFHLLMSRHFRSFPEDFYLPSFLDNHDMSRFLYDSDQDKGKLKKAARIQFSRPQPPILYYGTEVGMTQYQPTSWDVGYSDVNARQMMIWNTEVQDRDLLQFYKELIRTRRSRAPVSQHL